MGNMEFLLRVIKYLKMTRDYKIRYKRYNRKNGAIRMNSFVDASFGIIHSDRKRHIELIIFIPFIEIIVFKS